jgi:hypothetical protein
MRNCILLNSFVSGVFVQDNSSKTNNSGSKSNSEADTMRSELETEIKKQKSEIEKRAKLMQLIWGDNFLSDSLH